MSRSPMRALRESRNRTQAKAVDELNSLAGRLAAEKRVSKCPTFTVRQMSKWESETKRRPYPHPDTRVVLELYFRRPVEELGLRPGAEDEPPDTSAVPVVTPVPFIGQSAAAIPLFAGGDQEPPPWLAQTTTDVASSADWKIAEDEVDLLRDAADDMDAQDQQFGGNRLWRPTRAHLLWVHHMIDRGIYDEQLGQQLHALAGKFTTSLGWFSYDAGLHAQARQYFSEALNAAMLTGDDVLSSRTLSNMARQAVDLNKGREAIRFARLAQTHAGMWLAPTRVTALLAIREAQGHARVGDAFNCESAIKRAWREWERGADDRDPDWTTFLNQAELVCLEGMCRLDLGQTARAQQLLAHSEKLQDVAHTRNRGMCLGRLATAAIGAGDIDHSIDAASKAMGLIRTAGMSSARAVQQLKIVHDGLAPHHRARGVGDLLEEIRAVVA
ncbi:hypothetical protein [Streptomyces sp. H27-C3]|uniref:hypothetical protein n=1 Tax=Streptomyces sp. H27-C3 TaxID=3046305 RepID=UPI0024BB11E3|nr:hypothetical protein [Streptomyces sp. H27-C3]MDJ0466044.1 hypothetical protein [Streptomyces sp. H27-C3]